MFASQLVFISWVFPRVVSEWVLVVMPRNSDGNVMPSNLATDANSVSPLATTSPDPLSTKFTLPRRSTAARTLTTSMNGMPSRPLRKKIYWWYTNIVQTTQGVIYWRDFKHLRPSEKSTIQTIGGDHKMIKCNVEITRRGMHVGGI